MTNLLPLIYDFIYLGHYSYSINLLFLKYLDSTTEM